MLSGKLKPQFLNCNGFADTIEDIEEPLSPLRRMMHPWQGDLGAGFGMLVRGRASGTALLFTGNDCEKLGHSQHQCHVEHKHVDSATPFALATPVGFCLVHMHRREKEE